MDLEKAFHRVPRKFMRWAMRVMDIPEWIITLLKATYDNIKNSDMVYCVYNHAFSVDIVVHQFLVLSILQIFIVMEAVSRDFQSSFPWEFQNADDLLSLLSLLKK